MQQICHEHGARNLTRIGSGKVRCPRRARIRRTPIARRNARCVSKVNAGFTLRPTYSQRYADGSTFVALRTKGYRGRVYTSENWVGHVRHYMETHGTRNILAFNKCASTGLRDVDLTMCKLVRMMHFFLPRYARAGIFDPAQTVRRGEKVRSSQSDDGLEV